MHLAMSAFVGFSLVQTPEETEGSEGEQSMPNQTYEDMAAVFHNNGSHAYLPENVHKYYSSLYNHEAEQL